MRYSSFLLAAGTACGPPPPAAPGPPVTVCAAASLRETVTAIADAWSARTGLPVRLRCDATSTLARQIREGARADVFVAAAPEWLEAAGPRERFDWLANRLVCVVSRDAPAAFDLRALDSLALAGEQVPAGAYARAALARLGVTVPARLLLGASVRDVLSKVSSGGAAAGIVYATDAAADPGLRIAFTFPEESHPKIVYAAGLLSPAGRDFFAVLREPWALEIARRHGFAIAP